MSKERALLNLCAVTLKARNICPLLLKDISELLAQPEQEQEPVAWMWTRNYEGGGYTNKVFEFLNDAEEYAKDSKTLKSPDIIRPLYTTLPKREPIEDGELEVWYSQHTWAMDKQEYMWGFRDAEKAHGITGGVQVQLNNILRIEE